MKKYVLFITLYTVNLLYGDGFENLKALQNQIPLLVAQSGNLQGASGSAPEIPYISRTLLGVQVAPNEEDDKESNYIYRVLGNSSDKVVSIPVGIDQEKADVFSHINQQVFNVYNTYQNSGHSVFGIAAQEAMPIIEKQVIEKLIPVSSPLSSISANSNFSSSSSGGGIGGGGSGGMAGGLLAALNGTSKLKKVENTEGPKTATATAVPAKSTEKPLLQRVQEYKQNLEKKITQTANDKADIAILTEFESELAKGSVARDAAGQERFNELGEFFGYLETPPTAPAMQAKVGRLRMTLKPKPEQIVAIATSTPTLSANGSTTGGAILMIPQ